MRDSSTSLGMTKDGRALSITAGQIFSVFCAVSLFPVCKLSAKELQPASLSAAAKYSARHRGLSLLVIQHGRTLFEQSAGTPRRIYSGTKAFWNLAALAAAQDRLLDLDQPVADTIAQWRDDPRKARVTIRQLLDFSAGLAPAFYLHENDAKDRDSTAIKLPLVAEPGSAFIYGPSALQVFYEVLKNKLREARPPVISSVAFCAGSGSGPQRYLLDRAGNPLLCIRLGIERASMGEARQTRPRRRCACYFARITRTMLARLARRIPLSR